MSITTENGTTVSLAFDGPDTVVLLDNPAAPADMNPLEVGRVVGGPGFQPHPFCAGAMRPNVLRAIADLIEAEATK